MSVTPSRVRAFLLALLCVGLSAANAKGFDHDHKAWDALLAKHVRWTPDGGASRVDYRSFAADRAPLGDYLKQLSSVGAADYARWTKPQQLAFLINAYNAFTVELILTRYPKLESIKDLGSFLQSPWKKKFFTLLGAERHLDDIEHGMIRAPGAFDEPRIHVAVVCASIGCPALRPQAYAAVKLEAQLEDSMRRFMGDRSRNRFDPKSQTAAISKIFDWYRGDWEKGHRGFTSVQDVLAKYADQLADTAADRQRLKSKQVAISYLDYDWRLNDLRPDDSH
jgi:hypothetical protein